VGTGETTVKGLVLTGATIAVLIALATTAGAMVVPSIAAPVAAPKYQPPPPVLVSRPSAAPTPPPSATPSATPSPIRDPRPASAFNTWAASLAKTLNIPTTALEAYAYAEWVLSQTRPACKVQWTTIAGIGSVASDHGRVGQGELDADGVPHPVVLGPALDGLAGRVKVTDEDGGALDGDSTWDHAIGPMQLLPSMWRASGVDGDGDGLANPHDIDDAALSAAYFLCATNNQDLSVVANWKAAVSSYHGMALAIDQVYNAAQTYGALSRDQRYPQQRR
jgi:membrane-bound lytic murein transglycosylase B